MKPDDNRRICGRLLCLIALVTAAALLSACGGSNKPAAAPGSPENPLVGKTTERTSAGRSNEADAKSSERPGYQTLVERQSRKPRTRFTPCSLVTRAEAKSILGAPIQALLEAPQGPTCVYRSKTGKVFITLAVQPLDFHRIRKQIRAPRHIHVAHRPASCGVYGQPMLYVSLSRGRVLTVGAPCAVARQFATRSVQRLGG